MSNFDGYRVRNKGVVCIGRHDEVFPLLKVGMFDLALNDSLHDESAVPQDP